MMRRRNSPPPRGQTARRAQDKEREIDSELRAARANRKASHAQKQQLRRLDFDPEEIEDTDDDTMVFDTETNEDESIDADDADDESAAR